MSCCHKRSKSSKAIKNVMTCVTNPPVLSAYLSVDLMVHNIATIWAVLARLVFVPRSSEGDSKNLEHICSPA